MIGFWNMLVQRKEVIIEGILSDLSFKAFMQECILCPCFWWNVVNPNVLIVYILVCALVHSNDDGDALRSPDKPKQMH